LTQILPSLARRKLTHISSRASSGTARFWPNPWRWIGIEPQNTRAAALQRRRGV